MSITIIGAGAIGGVIGAYLLRNGEDVTFIDRDYNHIKAIREKGLMIKLKDGSFTVQAQAHTVEEFLQLNKPLDEVFLAVKAQHTREAIQPFEKLMDENSYVVSFQNGLCENEIAKVVGESRTVGCFVNLFADYLEPGVIEYGGVGSLYIGEIDGTNSERVNSLVKRLQCWGEAKQTTNIYGYLWSKLSYGAMLTATALTNNEIADFFEDISHHPLMNDIGTEVLQIANTLGIKPEPFDNWEPGLLLPFQDEQLRESYFDLARRLRGYTKTRTGIWRDLAVRKRKTEVPDQLNPVIAIGEKNGLEVPLLKKIVEQIQEVEEGKRALSLQNLVELQEAKLNI